MPIHWLHIYQRPKAGNAFLARYPIFNYRHKISAYGGFDTMSGELAISSVATMERALEQFIGCRVAVYVDNPEEPIWEGLINRTSFDFGGATFSRSLDEMINAARVVWSNADGAQSVSTALTQASIDIYGRKDGSYDAMTHLGVTTAGTSYATALQNMKLYLLAYPQTSIVTNPGGGRSLFRIECIGFYHVLTWQPRTSPSATLDNASVAVSNAVGTILNTEFVSTSTTLIESNTTFTHARGSNNNESLWQYLLKIAEAGDGGATTPWVVGVTPTQADGTRQVYYRAANLNDKYSTMVRDGANIIRRSNNRSIVPPWSVTPNGAMRVLDVLQARDELFGDNPNKSWIEVIEYDAESRRADWRGADDLTMEGALGLRGYIRKQARLRQQPRRTL